MISSSAMNVKVLGIFLAFVNCHSIFHMPEYLNKDLGKRLKLIQEVEMIDYSIQFSEIL